MLILGLFIAIFATIVLLLLVLSAGRNKETKQTMARLEAIRFGPQAEGSESDEPLSVKRKEILSAIPWLDKLLQRLDIATKVHLLLYQAELSWTPGRVLTMAVLAGLVAGYLVYWRTGSIVMTLLFTGLAGSLPFVYVLRKRSNRFERLKERLPEALDLMVSAIRAGHSFSSAMGMSARESPEPVKREFRQCFDEQNFGLDLRVAMANLAYRAPLKEIRMITAAILIQKETGGNLTEILEKVSMLIREDFRLQRQVRVHTAQGRMTGWILTCLPPILGVAMYFVNPEHMSLLWRREAGVRMLEGALVSTCIGGLIIRKIIRIQI